MVTDVIIVGAGLSGLVAAQQIQAAGKTMTILDKGRSVGGRLATRRIGEGLADHGAQFFTVRSDPFQAQVDKWLSKDLVYVWGHGWGDGSLKKTGGNDGHPRYATRNGMNSLARDLAESLNNIQINTKVTQVQWQDDIWQLKDGEGDIFTGKMLIMTPPVPQTLALVEQVPISDDERKALQRVQYGPCLCGLFVIDGGINLPEPGAIQNFDKVVYWVADNQAKGISPNEHIITMHIEARYSRKHYDDPDEEILSLLRDELQQYLTDGTVIKEEQLKKWRYSVPLTTYPHDILQSESLPIIFAGDAFGGRGRVEGAYLSGLAAGQAVVDYLS